MITNKRLLLFTLSLLTLNTSVFSALPRLISAPGERLILVDPRQHEWGAYTEDGMLVRSGVASTGKNYCADIGRPCRTREGTYRIFFMGDSDCYSTRFPIPKGGAPMPYCMYFNGNQALHGSYQVGRAHLSHGCVRLRVSDARWLRYNFAEDGTLVRIMSY